MDKRSPRACPNNTVSSTWRSKLDLNKDNTDRHANMKEGNFTGPQT